MVRGMLKLAKWFQMKSYSNPLKQVRKVGSVPCKIYLVGATGVSILPEDRDDLVNKVSMEGESDRKCLRRVSGWDIKPACDIQEGAVVVGRIAEITKGKPIVRNVSGEGSSAVRRASGWDVKPGNVAGYGTEEARNAASVGSGDTRLTKQVHETRWCPAGLSKTQRRRLQKIRRRELEEKRAEEERDRWFNQARPMIPQKKTWKEKRLAREVFSSDTDSATS